MFLLPIYIIVIYKQRILGYIFFVYFYGGLKSGEDLFDLPSTRPVLNGGLESLFLAFFVNAGGQATVAAAKHEILPVKVMSVTVLRKQCRIDSLPEAKNGAKVVRSVTDINDTIEFFASSS